MAWLAVNKNGTEKYFGFQKPNRDYYDFWYEDVLGQELQGNTLESGTIEKLIGRKLTWEDEPVEI